MSATGSNGSPRPRLPPAAPFASTPVSSPASARRRGVTPSILSPLSTLANSTSSPAHSFRSTSYAQSSRSPESVSGQSLLQLAPSTRYRSFSAAASQAGSLATTTANTQAGATRFKRSHARRRPGQPPLPPAPPVVKSANPDDVDLLALEDPDDVFRAFGVRDVRKIEQRASEAAAAKVAELRSMVGERYRDLLSAADSIVRMRNAADKLVDRLETAEDSLGSAGAASDASPSKRRQSLRSARRLSLPNRDRSLSSSTTVAHALQLLLTIPSLVHSKLDSADFLAAARLEDLGQVVYRQLSEAEAEATPLEEDTGDSVLKRRLTEVFPLIEKQAEPLAALGPLVLRRALVALHDWEADASVLAHTLAAIVMLRHTDATAALSTFLDARSQALEELLQSPASTSKVQRPDSAAIAERLFGVLALVLRTVEAAYAIFDAAAGQDSLGGLLRQLQQKQQTVPFAGEAEHEQSSPALPPLLASFPNAPVLQRHLPSSILEHRPSVSTDACSASALRAAVEQWTGSATKQIIGGFSAWISSLSEAKALADLRQTGRRALSTSRPSSSTAISTAHELQFSLERTIEARLAEVYRARLDALVARVRPSIETLLLALPESTADSDPATFLFDTPLTFPSASLYAPTRRGHSAHGEAAIDPFESFLVKLGKRVDGRSPLLDKGVTELEDAAREIRVDLDSWLGNGGRSGAEEDGDAELRKRLREEYVVAAGEALVGVVDAIGKVVQEVQHDVDGSLFLGNFVYILSTSPTFAADLLLAEASHSGSSVLASWRDRLEEVQQASLVSWRAQTVETASAKLRESMNLAAAQAPEATLWAWESSKTQAGQANGLDTLPIPSAPSNATLSALTVLATAMRHVGLHRSNAHPAIASSLVGAFVDKAVQLATEFASAVEAAESVSDKVRSEIAIRVAWDLALLVKLASEPSDEALQLQKRFLRMTSSSETSTLSGKMEVSILDYLRRAQTIFSAIIPPALVRSAALAAQTAEQSGAKAKSTPAINRLLPLGPAVSAFSAVGDLHGAAAGLVKPGPRLGLLPTRG
ncbi:hypothetical protein JCM10908_004369 [Rhodotorula pacifica]|uniref:uncharacterized protein n=1 Tax=Rhodotorula pacifica TaxID=1495444 RepID=UPI00317FF104